MYRCVSVQNVFSMCCLITWTYCLVLEFEYFPRFFGLLADDFKQLDFILLFDVWKSMTSFCLQISYRNTVGRALLVPSDSSWMWCTVLHERRNPDPLGTPVFYMHTDYAVLVFKA